VGDVLGWLASGIEAEDRSLAEEHPYLHESSSSADMGIE